jgi:hypothetical protein
MVQLNKSCPAPYVLRTVCASQGRPADVVSGLRASARPIAVPEGGKETGKRRMRS